MVRGVLTHGVDGVDVVEIKDGVDVVNVQDIINGVGCCRSSATKAYSHKCTQRGLKSFHDSHICKFLINCLTEKSGRLDLRNCTVIMKKKSW